MTPDETSLERFRADARRWLSENLEPVAPDARPRGLEFGTDDTTVEEIDEQRRLQRRLYEAGYAGISLPTEYGGRGLPLEFEQAFQDEASAFRLPDLGIAGGATFAVCLPTLLAHASPAFLARHVPRILAGEEILVQFFSDPDAGTDLAGVRTQAVRDGDRWILNGSKIWSSGAYYADVGMCLARTDWDAPKHRGLTWFAVPTTARGVTIERIRQVNGNSEFCQEYFDDVVLSDDDVIGEVNDGWPIAQTMLLYERGGGLAQSLGAPARHRGLAPEVVRAADAGRAMDDPLRRDLVARVHVDDLARAALGRRLGALMAARPEIAANVASYGKLAAGIYDPIRGDRLVQIAGRAAAAWSTSEEVGASTALTLLNSRFMAIAGGTTQVQRNSIGERVLGLPREPSFDSRKPFRDVVREAANWSGQVG